jgi:phosphoribosylanthranilate isomerase
MTFVKICGITRLADALEALEAGADLLGFNFYAPSPRSITPDECAAITARILIEHPQATLVGVFVNMPLAQIDAILERCSLQLAQLHGDETPAMLAALDGRGFKAFRGVPPETTYADYAAVRQHKAPVFLVDALVTGLYGGSGVTADWQAAAQLAKQVPILLAGGLKPENVAEAVRQVRPWGVDTASGVETNPREKNSGKIKAFIQAVRSCEE